MKTVLVIGGGVTGLSAMYELHKWKKNHPSDVRLILTEASSELGGKICTLKNSGFIMESGADSIVARKMNIMPLIEELGLAEKIVYNATGKSFIYTDGELKPIPEDSVFGIPATIESLAKSTLVSAEGKVEALKDFYTKNESFSKDDSIGSFLEYFLGKELVEKQIAPVLSGVYSGKLNELTISSTLPYVLDYKEQYGSIIKGFEVNKEKYLSGGERKFFSFNSGLSSLIDAFEERLDHVEILKNTKVEKIVKENNLYRVSLNNGEWIEADYVILSIPQSAAELLFPKGDFDQEFAPFKNSSLISIYLGFEVPDDALPTVGTGFITASSGELVCDACTWTSRKWAHTSEKGNLLVRLFYKSSNPAYSELIKMSEEELSQLAISDLKKSLNLELTPIVSQVTKWSESMPNYLITHPKSVEDLERKLSEIYPGIYLAGCSYYGVGIPDCIESGIQTARGIIEQI